MRPYHLRLALALWAVYTMFAPPGLPACWLEKEPCEIHVHFSLTQAETPHSHFYLIDLTLGTSAQPQPFVHLESSLLVLLLSLSGMKVWQSWNRHDAAASGWAFTLEPPPPRRSLSSLPTATIFGL